MIAFSGHIVYNTPENKYPGVAQLVARLLWELVVRPPFPYAKSEETREKQSICEHFGVCKTHKIGLTTYLTRTAKSSFSHSFYKKLNIRVWPSW